MCGIAGVAHWGQAPDEALEQARAMAECLKHRGPDALGVHQTAVAALGHTRLSIIDLRDVANQPMSDPTGRWTLTYNGEIYNYLELRRELERDGWRFSTESDTEVVFAALVMWGPKSFARFNGMWALALLDAQQGSVLLSRDRFGVKPLYFHRSHDGRLLFASEPKSLIRVDRSLAEPDDDSVSRFLLLSSMAVNEATFYRRIRRVPAASYLLFSEAGTTTTTYWDYPEEAPSPPSFADAQGEFRSLLTDAVRLRLRADVPVATTLSGGLDSSAIAGIVHGLGVQNHTTFTAAYPGEPFDEAQLARSFSESLGFPNHAITDVNDALDLDLVTQIVHHMDGPTMNPATVPLWRIMAAIRQTGTKVVLEGQGADELLGGYTNQVAPAGVVDDVAAGSIGLAVRDFRDFASRWGTAQAAQWFIRTQVPGAHALYVKRFGAATMAGPRVSLQHSPTSETPIPPRGSRVNSVLRKQHATTLRPLLEYGDRIAMAHGIESRLPFMDYRIVEFVAALPARYKVQGGLGKVLLREAVKDIVTPSTLAAPKLGFVTPLQRWFSGTTGAAAYDLVARGRATDLGYVDGAAVARSAGSPPSVRRAEALFRLLTLEVWLTSLTKTPRDG